MKALLFRLARRLGLIHVCRWPRTTAERGTVLVEYRCLDCKRWRGALSPKEWARAEIVDVPWTDRRAA